MTSRALRLAFMGSPAFAVPTLRALSEAGHEIVAVYCQPPRPSGRGQKLTRCPVHEKARELGLPIRTPVRLRHDVAEHETFAALDLDAAVVAAYGLLLPKPMLMAPRIGCLNVHGSLLPRWRGASPVQSAILAGDTRTGITIMRMEEGLDTGPILLAEEIDIGPTDDAENVLDRLSLLGGRLILRALREKPAPVPQPEQGVTHAPKINKVDGRLNWWHDAAALERRVRAFRPWPGAFFEHRGESVRVLSAEVLRASGAPGLVIDERATVACDSGTALRLTRLQRPGRAALDADDFLRGFPLPAGSVLN